MSRLDALPENSIVSRVALLRQTFNELKGSQRTGSADLQPSRVVTTNTYDINTTVTYNNITIWEVVFTPNNRPSPNTGFLWKIFYNATLISGTANFLEVTEQLPGDTSIITQRLYLMGRASGFNSVLGIKIVIYAIGNGTISISQIQ